jgi:single-stranded-DNA-specific exonuclease
MRFAPKLNALSRLELGILPIELFLEKDDRQAEAKVAGVIEFNKMRMDLQKSAENSVLSNCAQRSSAAVIDFSSSYHRGVVGLVATKVAQSLGVPAFIGSVAEDGLVVGSARLPVGSTQDLTVILSSAKDVLDHFGGHAAAAGFTLPVENLDAFRESIELHLSQWQVGDSAQQPRIIFYDDLASLDQMDEALMQWYDRLEPFGSQFQIPIYRFSGVGISQIRELRGGHLKISLSQAQRQMDGLWFSPPKDQLERLNKLSEGGIIADIIAEPQRNYFRGKMSVQLLIHGMRLASA